MRTDSLANIIKHFGIKIMWLVALVVIVAIAAFWVAYEVNKDGGYPVYRDNTENVKQEKSTWPFPGGDKP